MRDKYVARNAEVLRLRLEEFWTQKKIAKKFGLSNARVGQILNEYGHYNNPLTVEKRKEQLYDFIIYYKRTHCGCSPSLMEIESSCSKIPNQKLARQYIQRLIKDGLIWKSPNRYSQSIEVIGGKWIPPKR